MNWMLLPLRRYAEFTGRSRRKEFWLFCLLVTVLLVVCMQLDTALHLGGTSSTYSETGPFGFSAGYYSSGGLLTAIAGLALLVPALAVTVRRLHDFDKSGWWILIGFIPLLGGLYLLFLYVQPGTRGPNRFGADPIAAPDPER
jgi:uncharacterized membrane protein YhaH (DUF805 family)